MPTKSRSHAHRRLLLPLLVVILLLLLNTPSSSADDLSKAEKAACKELEVASSSVDEKCIRYWFELESEELSKLNANVKIASTGDETDSREQYKLDTSMNLTKGLYPHQLDVNAGTTLRLVDGDLEEEVTNLEVHYDRYFAPLVEGWVFAIRSSDSFLDIEQRYEVGFGADFEYRLTGRGASGCSKWQRRTVTLRRGTSPNWGTTPHQRLQAFKGLADRDRDFRKEYCDALPGLYKRHAMLTLSLGLSVFAEFEQAEALEIQFNRLNQDGEPVSKPITAEVSIPSEQRFRWAVRPAFTYQPTESVSITGRYYWKLPLDSPKTVAGRSDFRREAELFARYALQSPDKVSVFFNAIYKYDNVPPSVPDGVLDLLSRGQEDIEILGPTQAEDSHYIFKLGLQLGIS